MNLRLDGQTALVTRGADRLGSVEYEVLAREGAEVAVVDADGDAAERVAADVRDDGGEAFGVPCDLTDRDEVGDAAETVRERTGGVDVLVNNAGIVDTVARVGDFEGGRASGSETRRSRAR